MGPADVYGGDYSLYKGKRMSQLQSFACSQPVRSGNGPADTHSVATVRVVNAKSGATTKRRLKAVKESLLKGSSGPTNGSNGSNTTAPQSSDKNIVLSESSISDSNSSHTTVSQSNDKNILGNDSNSDSKKRTRPTVSAVCFRVALYFIL